MTRIDDYRHLAAPGAVDIILKLAERVRGRSLLHVSGERLGDGAVETLRAAVPILNDLGLDTRWEVTGVDPAFDATSRALQAALEGAERVLTDEALAHWVEMSSLDAKKLDLHSDLVVVHDVQPASLVAHRQDGCWVWGCHFDCSRPQHRAWAFFRQFVGQYDALVIALPEFGRRVGVPQYVIAPSIDPLSEKHRELSPREVSDVLAGLQVAQDKPLLVQVGPFGPGQDPLGAVDAYRLVKKHYDVRLVLAGPASDERESLEVLADLREAAHHDADIAVLELPADAHLPINALQRAATIVLETSGPGGFGLGAAEAMWKGKPVLGRRGGGLGQQIIHDVTGYSVHSGEGAAFRIRHLLNNPELIARMGTAGREHVRRSFLITRQLTDYLALLIHLVR